MIQANVKPSQASRPAPEPADALAAVVDSATAVARAEVRLAKAEVKAWLTRIGLGLMLLWLALLLLQVFALLLALTPVLSRYESWQTLGLVLLLSLAPALSVGFLAWRELKQLKEPGHGRNADAQD